MDPDDADQPLKDYGSTMYAPVQDDEIEGHHTDRWQNQAMYVGLHFPRHGESHKKRHRHRRHHRPKPSAEPSEDENNKPPPSERVQFILGGTGGEGYDDEEHQSHDIFCEMDELRPIGEDGDMEWKETARWVKFEEDVEEGGERWSKPHVATLSLHSLFELRKGILSGSVMLDLEANNLFNITDLVLDNMIGSKQLAEENRERVQEVLLSRHRHQHDKHEKSKGLPIIRSIADIGKKPSEKKLEDKLKENGSSGSHLSTARRPSAKDLASENRNESAADLHDVPSHQRFNEHFLKKIPPGAEASNILVGEVDFLKQPVIAFVRLAKAALLGDLTEVPVPTRFIFILLGPQGNQARYHEIGRSIATLMSDEVFHDVAYKARNRGDLLAGIDEFLDQVTVLPPGEWDPTIRIEPPKSVPSQESRKKPPPDKPGVPNGLVVVEEEEEQHGDATLVRTGRLFGGLINDLKRKGSWYLSDFKDAIHVQCIASIFFMYFACLTPIITFGGLLGAATNNNIAAMESLLSGAICGITYHMFSGQPLTVIGSTGPVLVFETIVYHFCHDNHLNYLAMRFWIGIWVALILMIMVAFDLSALVRYITRFTEESFALLIALIFIVEAFKKLFHILDHNAINLNPDDPLDYTCWCEPKNETLNNTALQTTTVSPLDITDLNATEAPPVNWTLVEKDDCVKLGGVLLGSGCDTPHYVADVFFWCVLLYLGTFCISYFLKNFRTSRFFPNKVRALISDFAVMIAIILMVGADILVGLPTPKLEVPGTFKPTRDDRGWVVNPFVNPVWCIAAALLPALLATILIFMDQQITAVIVNRKENLLRKGGGYHLDLFLISIQIAICSILGIPWFVAATVLSINHVRSLTRESETSAPGERPKFLGVREQRVTGTIVFLMVGLSVLLTSVLVHIPMAVLYGVFLFMGVSALKGVQMVQRLLIVFMPPKYQPDYIFLRHVPLRRVHLFTAIQALCLAVLWVIKTIKSISIVFPLMVLAMCFVRKGLDWVFTRHELKWLDDIMPEIHKREKEEKKKKALEDIEKVQDVHTPLDFMKEGGEAEQVIEMTGGAVNIPLKDGKSISIPVDRITYDPKANKLNVSDEMSKTAIWKQLAANESNPSFENELRQRGKNKPNSDPVYDNVDVDTSKVKREPVRFTIADDEDDSTTPAIVVDPPSKKNSPDPGSPLNNDSKA